MFPLIQGTVYVIAVLILLTIWLMDLVAVVRADNWGEGVYSTIGSELLFDPILALVAELGPLFGSVIYFVVIPSFMFIILGIIVGLLPLIIMGGLVIGILYSIFIAVFGKSK